MRVKGLWIGTLSAVILLGGVFAAAARAADKSAELNRSVAEMESAREVNINRINAAKAKGDELRQQVLLFWGEIALERRRSGVGSLGGGLQIPRIANDLKLIQKLTAYIDHLELQAAGLQAANLRLEFLVRQAGDDLLMLRTLKDADITRLTRRIRGALDECALQAQKPLIVVSELRPRDIEALWKESLSEPQR